MTEGEWFASMAPEKMLAFVLTKKGRQRGNFNRRLRLFACACYRRIDEWMTNEPWRTSVEVSERFADGLATKGELDAALNPPGGPHYCHLRHGVAPTPGQAENVRSASALLSPDGRLEREYQCAILRDIIRPFRARSRPSELFSWNFGTIPKLAETIHTDRAFERLPILADALEEAGCTDADILQHCRGPGPHVRGCWVVDLLLDKK